MTRSPGLKSSTMYGPVPNSLVFSGASRDFAPMKSFMMCFGRTAPLPPANGTCQPPVGSLKVIFTVFGSTAWTLSTFAYVPARRGGRLLVRDELEGERHVVGRERLAVRPLDALLQLVGDRLAVRAQAAVLGGRHLGRQDRRELALAVRRDQRLDARCGPRCCPSSPRARCGFRIVGACQSSIFSTPPAAAPVVAGAAWAGLLLGRLGSLGRLRRRGSRRCARGGGRGRLRLGRLGRRGGWCGRGLRRARGEQRQRRQRQSSAQHLAPGHLRTTQVSTKSRAVLAHRSLRRENDSS